MNFPWEKVFQTRSFWSSSLTLALTILYVQILDEIPIKTLVFHSAKFIFRRTHMTMIIWPGDFRCLMIDS